jgi:hypothetical protein
MPDIVEEGCRNKGLLSIGKVAIKPEALSNNIRMKSNR